MNNTYTLLDSGHGRKLERFGPYTLSRPCSQAVWTPNLPSSVWNSADALFSREGENKWTYRTAIPSSWNIEIDYLSFKITPTDFGHLGIFPEQIDSWKWIQKTITSYGPQNPKPKVLNLFAYSGGSTMASAKAGASVCHLDASKGMVAWARENASLNHQESSPIRWIIEDVTKFLARELKRGSRYEGIILDPPSFGRGTKGEIFKIEEEIVPLLNSCRELLSEKPLFILFSCHTNGFSPIVMEHLMSQLMKKHPGVIEAGEMVLKGEGSVLDVPSGTFARWAAKS